MPRPADPLRRSALVTCGVAFAALASLALLARAELHLGGLYPLKATAPYAVAMLLATVRLRDHHPFARFGAANQVTTARAALVALVAALIGEPVTPAVASSAVAVAVLATLLDGVDGWLARRTRMTSAFGARFDMETDAALIQALAILAWRYDKAGPWVVLSGTLRYLFVAAGSLWPWMRRPLAPSIRAKTICILQIGALMLVVAPPVSRPFSTALAAGGLTALGYSFLVDVLWLFRHAGDNGHVPPRTR